jgi:four helix bundle protein
MARNHERLEAFQIADHLVLTVYRATSYFPREERFGLSSQIRRAAVSTATNIVEGCARRTRRDYLHFLNVAHASAAETRYLISLSHRLGFLTEDFEECEKCSLSTVKLLQKLQEAVEALP